MPLLFAATAADGNPNAGKAILLAAAFVWAVGYVVACAIWPFKACRRCTGAGRLRSPSGRAWRRCPRCTGSGGRLRIGRHIYNWVSRTRDDAR